MRFRVCTGCASLTCAATGNAAFGNEVVESTFQLAGAVKVSATVAKFFTTSGGTITLDGTAQTGTLEMGGITFPVLPTYDSIMSTI